MARVIYDGSAQDHHVTPEVLKKGEDGRPMKRKVVKPSVTVFTPIETFNLRGMLFPRGTCLDLKDADTIKKAESLGCFQIEIKEGEPVFYQKAWLESALLRGRVSVVDEFKGKADAPLMSEKKAHKVDKHSLEGLSRIQLLRMASTRGLSVKNGARKKDILELVKADLDVLDAEDAEDSVSFMPEVNLDSMQDVG